MLAPNGGNGRLPSRETHAGPAKMVFDVDDLALFPRDSSGFASSVDEKDAEAEAETQSRTMNYQHFERHSSEQRPLTNDETKMLENPCVNLERSKRVQWASNQGDQLGPLSERDEDSTRRKAVKNISGAYLMPDDDYPSNKTYDRAIRRGGCEWRRKREEEKAVARRIFTSPSDWSVAPKVNQFLLESRRIWK